MVDRLVDRTDTSTAPSSLPSSPESSLSPSTYRSHTIPLKRKGDDPGMSMRARWKKAAAERHMSWHPRYAPDTAKVILISIDQKKFSVDKTKLSEQVTAFRDAFSLPTNGEAQDDQPETIDIDESADDLTFFLDALGCATNIPTPTFPNEMNRLAKLCRMACKYDAAILYKIAQYNLEDIVMQQPYKALAYASDIDDLDLGRQAIRSIQFRNLASGGDDFWGLIFDLSSTWQLAFAKLVIPKLSRERAPDTGIKVQCNLNMVEIALRFEPE